MANVPAIKSLKADINWDNDWANKSGLTSKIKWSVVPMDGVVISNPNSTSTTVSFSSVGNYIIKVNISDGAMTATDYTLVNIINSDFGNIKLSLVDNEPITITTSIHLPPDKPVFDKVDCALDIDTSWTMKASIETVKAKAVEIINSLFNCGRSIMVGVHRVSSGSIKPDSNRCNLTSDQSTIVNAINQLCYIDDASPDEQHLESLIHTINTMSWRPRSLRLYLQITDEAANHPAPYDQALQACLNNNIRIIYIQNGGAVNTELMNLVNATDGMYFSLDASASAIVGKINEALYAMSRNLTVKLVPNGAPAGLVTAINPVTRSGINPGNTFTFDVTFCRKNLSAGSGVATYNFNLEIIAEDFVTVDNIPVSITVKW